MPLEVQAFRLNHETAIVTLPSEIFVEIGLAIKAASPFKTTLVIELANDRVGLHPDEAGVRRRELRNRRIRASSPARARNWSKRPSGC